MEVEINDDKRGGGGKEEEERNGADPSGLDQEEEEVFEVEAIEKVKGKKGSKMYLVKWKTYGEDRNTWEPAEVCTSPIG